jgi:DNA-binding NarL/FixJ family response regulator
VDPLVKIITITLLSAELFEQSGDIYRAESLKAGADAFIPKYHLTRDLVSVIQTVLHPVALV